MMFEHDGVDGLIGRTLNGFRITRFIARGGMGMVYEGVQESLDRPVAIKVLYPHLSDEGQFRERFELEARHHARLSHPNIVHILDFGIEGIVYYMVMDLVEGQSLRDRLAEVHNQGLTLGMPVILKIVQQIGSALAYAHRNGYVHRDVKPGNILLTSDGDAILTDFGVVKILGGNQLTSTGMIIGTPEYMAPEQGRGLVNEIGPAADQYSLAVVTYEMMVGRVPFQAQTPHGVLQLQLTEPPPAPRSIVPWFSPDVEAVLLRALDKEPGRRYEGVDRFVQELTDAVLGVRTGVSLTPGTTPPSITPPQSTGTPPVDVPEHSPVTATPQSTPPVDTPAAPVTQAAFGRRHYLAAGGIAVLALILMITGYSLFRAHGSSGQTPTPSAVASSATGTAPSTATAAVVVSTSPTATASSAVPATSLTATATPVPEPTPTSAVAVAPTGSQLAVLFSSHRGTVHDSEIYIMNPDGSGERQITQSRGHSWAPRVSPDGKSFFFSSVAPGEHSIHDASGGGDVGSGNHDIYVADFSGSTLDTLQTVNLSNITAGFTSWDNGWSWSPDGKWITFTTDRDGNWELYKMTRDGKNIVRLTNAPSQEAWPSWTPDGLHIIFNSDRTGNWEIFEMDADGNNVKQLTDRPGTANLYPAVSPDGQHIVFSAQDSKVNEGSIYLMNLDGSNLKRLTNTVALDNIPSFCPDSNRIVFTSDRNGNEDVFMMNVDGTNQVALTTDPGEDTAPNCTYVRLSTP